MSLDFKSSVLICSNLLLNQLFLKLNSLLQSAISHHTSSMKVIKPSCLHAARETALGMQNTTLEDRTLGGVKKDGILEKIVVGFTHLLFFYFNIT